MNILASKRYQRVTNFALAALLVVSTITASVPFLFSEKANALGGYDVTVSPECVDGLVKLNITGRNPNGTNVWVKSSANFKFSPAAQANADGATADVSIQFDQASIPNGGVTIYYSDSENGTYQLLNDPTAMAAYNAINCYDTVYVSPTGNDANAGTQTGLAFATIQKALDTVNVNGTVKVADGTYAGTAWIKKNGTKLVGTSGNRDAVTIVAAGNAAGQGGVYSEGLSNLTIENLAVTGGPTFTNGGVIKLSNGSNGTIHNVVVKSADIVTPGAPFTNTTGININGFANLNVDNVAVLGMGRDGISIVGQQNGSVVTKNVALNNVVVSGRSNSWSGLAFDTKQASITGVTLNDVRLQYGDRGVYVDGNNLANTVTTTSGILQLGNTLIKNVNKEYVNNEQTANINASGISVDFQNRPVYVDTLAVKDLNATELENLRTNFIKDKSHKNPSNFAYGVVFLQGPAAPTGLNPNGWTTSFSKFAWTASTDAATYNVRYSRVHPNEVANAPILSTTNATPEYATTLADGPLFWQVQAVDAAGNTGAWSDMGYATIDTTAPTSTNDLKAVVAGTQTITQTITDNVQAKSGKIRIWKQNADGTLNNSQFFASGDVNVNADNKVTYTVNTVANLFGNGTYTAKFTATDMVGHQTVSEKVFVVDNTNPDLSVKASSIGNGTIFKSVSFQLHDNYKIEKFTIKNAQNENTFNVSPNDYGDANDITVGNYYGAIEGENAITLYDLAGNSVSQTFVLDTKAPTAPTVVYTPSNGSFLNTNMFLVDWDASVDASPVTYEIRYSQDPSRGENDILNGSNVQTVTANTDELQVSGLGEGYWFYQIRATDAAKNVGSWSNIWSLVVDTVDPTADISSPTNDSTLGNVTNVNITGSSSDANGSTYVLKIDGQTVASGSIFSSYNWTTPTTGPHTIVLTVTDAAKNVTTDTANFTVDNQGPALTIDEQGVTTNRPVITGTFGADAENVAVAIFDEDENLVESGPATLAEDGTYAYQVQDPLAYDATYTVAVGAFDQYENLTMQFAIITVESAPVADGPTTPTTVGAAVTPAQNAVIATIVPTITPAITSPAAAAVLGATDTASNDGAAEVKGTNTDNFAAIDVNNNDGKIFGLAWFWWILILAAIAAAAWWIIGAVRRRNENNA